MHRARKVFGSFKLPFHERLVDDHLGRDVRQFASLPHVHLLPHRFEIPLHSVDADRDAVDQGERLRVFGEHGVKSPLNAMFEHTNTR